MPDCAHFLVFWELLMAGKAAGSKEQLHSSLDAVKDLVHTLGGGVDGLDDFCPTMTLGGLALGCCPCGESHSSQLTE